MNKTINVIAIGVLVSALAFPFTASARGNAPVAKGNPRHGGGSARVAMMRAARTADTTAALPASASKQRAVAWKAAHRGAKSAGAQERGLRKQSRETSAAERPMHPNEGSSEATVAAHTGIAGAFSRIAANLAKSLSMISAGRKTQLPPGLLRVWLKFASWLGVDTTTMPGAGLASPGNPAGETTQTVEPTGTVAPMPTQLPVSAPDGSAASAP